MINLLSLVPNKFFLECYTTLKIIVLTYTAYLITVA